MIAKDTFTSYAQYNEDIILAALLEGTKNGFYVDVGANHEAYHSVTKYFYERGWHGINIEPIPRLIKEIAAARPKDINLNYAVSSEKGVMKFREYPKHDGFSTFSEKTKKENEKRGLPFKDYDIKVDSLQNIFAEHKVKTIDFLKVDVEGFESEVLHSNDWKEYRPRVICIEANHSDDWASYLVDQKYERIIFDGLNEYYVAHEERKLFSDYAERAAVLVHNALRDHHEKLWKSDLQHMQELRDMTERQDAAIKALQHAQQQLELRLTSIKFLLKQVAKQLLRRVGIK